MKMKILGELSSASGEDLSGPPEFQISSRYAVQSLDEPLRIGRCGPKIQDPEI